MISLALVLVGVVLLLHSRSIYYSRAHGFQARTMQIVERRYEKEREREHGSLYLQIWRLVGAASTASALHLVLTAEIEIGAKRSTASLLSS